MRKSQLKFSGQQLRLNRRAKRLSLKKLAIALALNRGKAITAAAIGNWERGKSNPLFDDVEALAAVMSIRVAQLCERSR